MPSIFFSSAVSPSCASCRDGVLDSGVATVVFGSVFSTSTTDGVPLAAGVDSSDLTSGVGAADSAGLFLRKRSIVSIEAKFWVYDLRCNARFRRAQVRAIRVIVCPFFVARKQAKRRKRMVM